MIRRSRAMLGLCAGAALAVHGAGLWVSDTPARIEIAGGAGASEAMLGSSFADMVAGAAQPVSDSTVTPNRQSDQKVDPVAPGEALRPEMPATAQAAPPPAARKSAASQARAKPATPEKPAPQPPPETPMTGATDPARAATAIKPALPQATAKPVQDVETARTPDAATATRAARSRDPAAPREVVAAVPETSEGLQVSRRPQTRPRAVETAAAARQSPEPERKTEARRTSGSNASRDATRGSTSGRKDATATRQGRDTARRDDAQGNAAASNYPGKVMRHLARVPRPRATSRGAALVRFNIAAGGRLASVGLARSSGSSRLDRAALTVVQRAAPFPVPPQGAQRRFSVEIKGR